MSNFDFGFSGDINPFYGDIGPFWGDISPFWGDIDPFSGDIGAFWGDIDAFGGDIDAFGGDIGAFYGDIGAFWGDIGPFWGDLYSQWGDIDPFDGSNIAEYQSISDGLDSIFNRAEEIFGPAVENATGSSFTQEIKDKLYQKYNLDTNDLSSFDNWSSDKKSSFFLDFYDLLMGFSGLDHIDHWMPAINWSPILSQSANGGSGVVVGLLDTTIQDQSFMDGKTRHSNGYDMDEQYHGAGVASIIAASHDGQGVMGLAPDATISMYNPFDETYTASWADVRRGIADLSRGNTSIINMSLGVPGHVFHEEWRNVFFDTATQKHSEEILFVKAAGNEGQVQFSDIEFGSSDLYRNFLFVGSVGATGEISAFSNTPGESCFLSFGVCSEENKLKYRFLVAPGELILVNDGQGGVTRRSGTSFAAPQVSGAAALLQSKWNWLTRFPRETADILLQTATDLGDPGVDATYGWCMLNVDAALSPIDENNLKVGSASGQLVELEEVAIISSTPTLIQSSNTITVIEEIGNTYRDFEVEVSAFDGNTAALDTYTQNALETYFTTQTNTTPKSSNGKGKSKRLAFSDVGSHSESVLKGRNWSLSFSSGMHPARTNDNNAQPYRTANVSYLNESNDSFINLGYGASITSFRESRGFRSTSDSSTVFGGANPVLGLASGGFYVNGGRALTPKLTMRMGISENSYEHNYRDSYSNQELDLYKDVDDFQSVALSFGLDRSIGSRFKLSGSYSRVMENGSLLGNQGSSVLSVQGDTQSDIFEVSSEWEVTDKLLLSSSASIFSSKSNQKGLGLSTSKGGLVGTAFEVAALKEGIFAKDDLVRLTIAQPIYVETGSINIAEVAVVDRQSGELGNNSRSLALAQSRPLTASFNYFKPFDDGKSTLNLFGRVAEKEATTLGLETEFMLGANIEMKN